MNHPQTKEEATRLANALKAKMKTKEWVIEVWHNLHWCYCIKSRWITIHTSYDGTYSAFMNDGTDEYSTADATGFWCSTVEHHADPNVAVANRIAAAEAAIKERVDKIAEVKAAYEEDDKETKKRFVTYSARFEAEITIPKNGSKDDIEDACCDIDIPEGGNNKSVYVVDTFEVEKISTARQHD